MAANQACRGEVGTITDGTEHRTGLILGSTRPDVALAHSSTLVRASQSLAPRGAAMPVPKSGHEVTVWSDVVHWPQVCPCCLGPADVTTEICHSTTTGLASEPKRVDSLTIPCCSSCIWHMRVTTQLRKLVLVPKRWINRVLVISGMVAIVGALVMALSRDDAIIGIGGGFLFISGIVFLVVAGIRTDVAKHNKVVAARRDPLEEELQKALTPSCCSVGSAVMLKQKDGAIHSFVFESADYAERFRQLNADSLLAARRAANTPI